MSTRMLISTKLLNHFSFSFLPAFKLDRKSTRLNSSHLVISYAVFCLKKKKTEIQSTHTLISHPMLRMKQPRTTHPRETTVATDPSTIRPDCRQHRWHHGTFVQSSRAM